MTPPPRRRGATRPDRRPARHRQDHIGGATADRFGAVLVSFDRLRKELAGVDPETRVPAVFGRGLYDGPHTAATYAELLRRAEALLGRGESVVLDASWSDAQHRSAAEKLADRTSSRLVQLVCRATAETTGRRLATRTRTASGRHRIGRRRDGPNGRSVAGGGVRAHPRHGRRVVGARELGLARGHTGPASAVTIGPVHGDHRPWSRRPTAADAGRT
jgi:predicted kinase